MSLRLLAGFLVLLALAGCSTSDQGADRCPKPVNYSLATKEKVEKALEALPPDNILHQVMADYEQERDDLRFCH